MQNEIPLSPGETANFHAAVIRSLPHDLDPVYARFWARNGGQLFRRLRSSGALSVGPDDLFRHCTRVKIRLGKYPDIETLEHVLTERGYVIHNIAAEMLRHPDFAIAPKPTTIELVIPRPEDLGLYRPVSYKDMYSRAQELGLELCPAEVGPVFRLVARRKFKGLQSFQIAMRHLPYDACGRIFELDADPEGRQRLSWHPGASHVSGTTQLAFMLPIQ